MTAQADIAQTFNNFGIHLARINEGMMRAMVADPSANNTDCVAQATMAGVEIQNLFNVNQYFDGVFNVGNFIDQAQISSIQVLSEFEKCGYNEFLILFDGVMSQYPELAGMGGNAITQFATGWKNKDTAMYKSYNMISDSWEKKDWASIGEGVQLFFSQLVKFESPDVYQNLITI